MTSTMRPVAITSAITIVQAQPPLSRPSTPPPPQKKNQPTHHRPRYEWVLDDYPTGQGVVHEKGVTVLNPWAIAANKTGITTDWYPPTYSNAAANNADLRYVGWSGGGG